MGYRINYENYNDTFTVPKSLAEKNLKIASSEQIKVILAVLSGNGETRPEELSARTGVSVYECRCALEFWAERGFLLSDETDTSCKETPAPEKKFTNVKSLEKPEFSDVLKRAEESDRVADLLRQAQMILGRTISASEQASLVFYLDTYGLPYEVVLMLLGYAKSIGKQNFRYIDKVALDWAEKEINTHEKAEKYIDRLIKQKEREYRVRRILSLGDRKLSANEQKLIKRWTEEFCFSDEMLAFGYDKTVDSIGKLDMRYLDKILTSLYQNGIKTIKAAENADLSVKEKKPRRAKTSYDLQEVEENLFKNG